MKAVKLKILEPRTNGFLHAWLDSLSPRTASAYSADLEQFFEWRNSDDVPSISREDCRRYMGHLRSLGLAPASVNRKFTAVRAMLKEAVAHEIRADNPAHGIRGFKAAGISKRTSAPVREQVINLLASIGTESLKDLRDRAIIYLAAGLGLRREEIAMLSCDSIGESQGQLVLTVVGKGNKTRQVAMGSGVTEAVLHYLAAAKISGDRPLIQSMVGDKLSGRPMDPNSIYRTVVSRLRNAGISGFSTHSFRAFFITEAIERGCDIYKVQRAAGHSDPRTTQGYDQARDDIEDSASGYVRI